MIEGYPKPFGYMHSSILDGLNLSLRWHVDKTRRTLTMPRGSFQERTQIMRETLLHAVRQGNATSPRKFYHESLRVVSFEKSTVPNKLDSTVAGAIRSDEQPLECMVRKTAAEASLPAEYIKKNIVSCDTISYQMDITSAGSPGVQQIVSYLYEMELKDELVPRPGNDEVCSFTLMNQEEVMAALVNGDFVPNRAMVWLAYFVRHGIVTPANEPDYLEIQSRLHKSHEMFIVEEIGG